MLANVRAPVPRAQRRVGQRRCVTRLGVTRPQRGSVQVAAALTAADLSNRALKLDEFDGAAVQQACAKLAVALGPGAKCDAATLEWFLRDRKLDVDKAAAKASHGTMRTCAAHQLAPAEQALTRTPRRRCNPTCSGAPAASTASPPTASHKRPPPARQNCLRSATWCACEVGEQRECWGLTRPGPSRAAPAGPPCRPGEGGAAADRQAHPGGAMPMLLPHLL